LIAPRRLQIGDRGYHKIFVGRQQRRAGGAGAIVQKPVAVRLGAQLIAAGDVNEVIEPGAQVVANVANQFISDRYHSSC
jgi:hypothetical protein